MEIMIITTILSLWLTGPILGVFPIIGVLSFRMFITSNFAQMGSHDHLIPKVFTPEGWGNLGMTIPHLYRNR